ncbi:UNVERIFIED_CONTAM: hypothetical protein GTU68_017783 [Idotea baltica]|nr:hypothetical protein [Idotea baltica]
MVATRVVVRGGASRKIAPILQPALSLICFGARGSNHIGSYQVEPLRSTCGGCHVGADGTAGLNAVTALLSFCLPEREEHGALYKRSEQLLDLLGQNDVWPLAYLRWELALLDDLGFGLDLSCCAATGATDGLVYVSPKSGRAVSRDGAGQWVDRMLPLPPIMRGEGDASDDEVLQALETTGYFLNERLAPALGNKPLPEARARLVEVLRAVST